MLSIKAQTLGEFQIRFQLIKMTMGSSCSDGEDKHPAVKFGLNSIIHRARVIWNAQINIKIHTRTFRK